VRAYATGRLHGHFGHYEVLAAHPACRFGGHPVPAFVDFYLAACLRWPAPYPAATAGWLDRAAYPAWDALSRRLDQRPSVIRLAKAEGLGAAPFSRPELPNPREGTAT